MRLFIFGLIIASCTFSYGRELKTIYAVGKYRTQNYKILGHVLRKNIAENDSLKAAWTSIVARAEIAKKELPVLRTLACDLAIARINNKINVDTARKAFDLALMYTIDNKDETFLRSAIYMQAFRKAFLPADQLLGINTNHQYHILYARDWLPYLAYSYDILYSRLNPKERDLMALWFEQMVSTIATRECWDKWKNQSHGAWQAAALGIVGSAIGKSELISLGKNRIIEQLSRNVSREGFWSSGSLPLHFTVTRAYLAFAAATATSGNNPFAWRDRYGMPVIFQMCNAPLMLLDPQGKIPGCDYLSYASPPADIYLQAYPHYNDKLMAAIAYQDLGEVADEKLLLSYSSPTDLASIKARPDRSLTSTTLGWGILRSNVSNAFEQLYARMIYKSTGHLDGLSLYLSGKDRIVMEDDDPYSSQSILKDEWVRETVAHNTVVLNYQSQKADAQGKLILFDRKKNISVVEADCKAAYPNIALRSFRRAIAQTDDYCIDVFTVEANSPVTADWVMHGLGKSLSIRNAKLIEQSMRNNLVDVSMLGTDKYGFKWIDGISVFRANEQWDFSFSSGLRSIFMGQAGTKILTGKSGGNVKMVVDLETQRTHSRNSLIVRRKDVKETRFVAVHEILKSNIPKIKSFVRLETGQKCLVLEVLTDTYRDVFILQSKLKAQSFMIDEVHQVQLKERRFGFVRFDLDGGQVLDAVNLNIKKY